MTSFLKKYYGIIVGLGVFGVYCYTLAPSLDYIDCGELATVQATLGIAHPTGYPLFTILGYLLLKIPLPFTKIYQANLLCAFWCAAGVTIFIYFLQSVITNASTWTKRKQAKNVQTTRALTHPSPEGKASPDALVRLRAGSRTYPSMRSLRSLTQDEHGVFDKLKTDPFLVKHNLHESVALICSSLGGIVLAFSKTYWLQSNSVEVYSLHMFLLLLIMFYLSKAVAEKEPSKNWAIFSVVLGLGFTNHMATMFLLPGAAYVYFAFYGFRWKSLRPLGRLFVYSMVPIILLYGFLLWRSAQHPALNWGDPSNLVNLYRHMSGAEYAGALFGSKEATESNLLNFFRSVPFEFAFGSLLFIIAGIPFVYMKARRLFYFLVISICYAFLFSANYGVRDIFTYYLLSYIGISVFIAFGTYVVLSWLLRNRYLFLTGFVITCAVIGIQAFLNFGTSHRNLFTYEDYARNVINSVDTNAVIFDSGTGGEWDYITSPLTYLQYVERLRTDVVVIDVGLLEMPWYHDQLEQFHPGIFKDLRPEFDEFSRQYEELYAVKMEPKYFKHLEMFHRLLSKIITENIEKRPVYFTSHFVIGEYQSAKIQLPEHYGLMPDLLLFKVVKDPQEYHPIDLQNAQIALRFPEYKNRYILAIEKQSSEVLAARALIYEKQFNKSDTAKVILRLLKENFPDFKYE